MKKITGMFSDANNEFSWRKIMTAGCLIVFMFAQIGYLVKHGFDELPTAYWAVDASVFGFYFLKKTIDNIKIGSNEKS
jgi:hypothetical protein